MYKFEVDINLKKNVKYNTNRIYNTRGVEIRIPLQYS